MQACPLFGVCMHVYAHVQTQTHKHSWSVNELIPERKSAERMEAIMQLQLHNCRPGHAAQSPTTTTITRRAESQTRSAS